MLPSDMQLVVICIPDIRVEQLISSGYFSNNVFSAYFRRYPAPLKWVSLIAQEIGVV